MSLTLGVAGGSSEFERTQFWAFPFVWEPADSFMREIFEAGEAIDSRNFAIELRGRNVLLIQDDVFLVVWEDLGLEGCFGVFDHDIVDFWDLVGKKRFTSGKLVF